jgi:uncharacterized protein YceH (UPF0502 family)
MTELDSDSILSTTEARILGALMEKQLTTPDVYPLTLNSLVTACNQKTSREPVMDLSEGEVQQSLYDLQKRALVKFEYGSRADKYDQRLTREYHMNDAEHAIFCMMLLRGPQTVNELLTRTRRMYEFSGPEELTALIDKLLNRTTPLMCRMPPCSGQREDRYMHLLCGEPVFDKAGVKESPSTSDSSASSDELFARIEELEKQVAWLMEKNQ